MKIVALLAVYNERRFIARCIQHLASQGVQTYVIDNQSTDGTFEIAQSLRGHGVIGVESLPRGPYFELVKLLVRKEQLHHELGADWYIHQDADEIRLAPNPHRTLAQGIEAADRAGYNAIDFDEFVFMPTRKEENFDHDRYVEEMRYYFFHAPTDGSRFHIKGWKKTARPIDLASTGGHQVQFDGLNVFPEKFILRHYIALSHEQVVRKYCTRRYSPQAVNVRYWHGARALVQPDDFRYPDRAILCQVTNDNTWDTSKPVNVQPLFGAAEDRFVQFIKSHARTPRAGFLRGLRSTRLGQAMLKQPLLWRLVR